MKQVIYVDVLLAVNFFVTYILLLATGRWVKYDGKKWRYVLGAVLGAAYSMVIFTPELSFLLSWLGKFFCALAIIGVSFKKSTWKNYFRQTAAFFILNFLFAGMMMGIWFLLHPKGLLMNNGIVYFNFSALALILSTLVSYLIIVLVQRLLQRVIPKERIFHITVHIGEKEANGIAFLDTGHALRDPFSDTPVIIMDASRLLPVVPEELRPLFENPASKDLAPEGAWAKRFRLIPYQTVGDSGLLPCLRPDSVTIKGLKKQQEVTRVYVGASMEKIRNGEYNALINEDVLGET